MWVSLKGGNAVGRREREARGMLGSKGLSMADSDGRGGKASVGGGRALVGERSTPLRPFLNTKATNSNRGKN
jgi:hypothetical protein